MIILEEKNCYIATNLHFTSKLLEEPLEYRVLRTCFWFTITQKLSEKWTLSKPFVQEVYIYLREFLDYYVFKIKTMGMTLF